MPGTYQTPNLNLNQYVGSDRLKREDYNSDMLKIDHAVAAIKPIEVGEVKVDTLPPDSEADIRITSSENIFNFSFNIPSGKQGPKGEPGPQGSDAPDLPFVYRCTGENDTLEIQNIINDFFENGTALSMKLVITGEMGLQASPAGTKHIAINTQNARGAVCHLDFGDCRIPKIVTSTIFFWVTGNARIYIDNLRLEGPEKCISIEGSPLVIIRNCILFAGNVSYPYCIFANSGNCKVIVENCHLTCSSSSGSLGGDAVCPVMGGTFILNNNIISGSRSGVQIGNNFFGTVKITNSMITGGTHGITMDSSVTTATIFLTGNSIKGTGTQDIQQSTAANTVKWYIMGNSFSRASIIVDGTTAISYKAASASIYFPQYANLFSRTIN